MSSRRYRKYRSSSIVSYAFIEGKKYRFLQFYSEYFWKDRTQKRKIKLEPIFLHNVAVVCFTTQMSLWWNLCHSILSNIGLSRRNFTLNGSLVAECFFSRVYKCRIDPNRQWSFLGRLGGEGCGHCLSPPVFLHVMSTYGASIWRLLNS